MKPHKMWQDTTGTRAGRIFKESFRALEENSNISRVQQFQENFKLFCNAYQIRKIPVSLIVLLISV